MRMSALVGRRYKEQPSDATTPGHALLLRGGYVRPVAPGIHAWLPPALRIIHKIAGIVREEMDGIGGQEMQAAATAHEAGLLQACQNEFTSYTQLPLAVYQIQRHFEDDARCWGGLIQAREYLLNEAYSLHRSQEDLERFYARCAHAYHRIFARTGLLEVISATADTREGGEAAAHTFVLLTESGREAVAVSEDGAYRALPDVAQAAIKPFPEEPRPLEKVHTPNSKTIEELAAYLGVEKRRTAKAVFYDRDDTGKLVLAIIRGDREVCEAKLAKLIGTTPEAAPEDRIRAVGAEPGFASPVGLDPRKVRILVDHTVQQSNNLVTGANEVDYHFINFNLSRDLPDVSTVDMLQVADGDPSPGGNNVLRLRRGIRLGTIVQQGGAPCHALDMTYDDEHGMPCTPLLGYYTLAVDRLMSAVMEATCDTFGPKWPISIAPWQVHINALARGSHELTETADRLYRELTDAGLEVLYDDRDARPGVQFAEADLLGIPFRVIVGERGLKQGHFEWKRRDTDGSGTLPVDGAVATLRQWVAEALADMHKQAGTLTLA